MTIIKTIKKSNRVAVFGHQSPDGDCLGSISAISFLCKKLGKQVDCFIDDDLPLKYQFISYSNLNQCEFDINNYDLLICVDVASEKLLGKYKEYFINFNNTIVIDHHYNRNLSGKLTIVKNTASCCEILYQLLNKYHIKISKDVATMIYMGIADDTGCFLHDNTTESTHKVAGQLIAMGADYKLINYKIFKFTSLKCFNMTNILNQNIVVDNGLAYIVVLNDFLKKNGFTKEDMGDYVNKLLNLENTKIAFVITEKQNQVYSISFRSLKEYDVSKIAQLFNGGGHKQASGGEIRGKIDYCIDKVVKACRQAIKDGDV